MRIVNDSERLLFRLLELARDGRRRGPRAFAAGATKLNCTKPAEKPEKVVLGQRVLKDAIDLAGY